MADGNGAYTLGTAIRMGRALEDLDFAWWEEPLPQQMPNYPAYEALAASLDIPIAAGEAQTSRGQFRDIICRRAMDIVQPDASVAGGIGECLFVAEMARLWGITAMPHCNGGAIIIAATAHLVSLLPDASWARQTEEPMLEYDLMENPFRDELLVKPLEIKAGRLAVPTGPGLGIEIDENVVRRYARH
jgi:D-galactarolactone cycloisomerase